jgi:hypothetical protein
MAAGGTMTGASAAHEANCHAIPTTASSAGRIERCVDLDVDDVI